MRDERAFKIIGAAMDVHSELGYGFLEAVYQEALEREFMEHGIPFMAQPAIEVVYRGRPLAKRYEPDFICYDTVIVEIKAVEKLGGIEQAQLLNYLKATTLKVGLLLNFGAAFLQYKRLVF
jgi:GxxExxY protein